jgi:hypothetical protein
LALTNQKNRISQYVAPVQINAQYRRFSYPPFQRRKEWRSDWTPLTNRNKVMNLGVRLFPSILTHFINARGILTWTRATMLDH